MIKDKRLIMLPGPTNIPERVKKAMMRPMVGHRDEEFRALYGRILNNLRYLFQTKGDVYSLTSSGTGGLECAISNIISPGDKVIVPTFGFFGERLIEMVRAHGGKPVTVRADWGTCPKLDSIKKAIDENEDAKAIAIVYNETSTGATFKDLSKLGKITDERGLILIVDAISILGGDELPTDKWGVDMCVAATQKCLACPPGLALLSVSERGWRIIEETKDKHVYYFDLRKLRDYEGRGETPFTPAMLILYALDEALKMIREEGLERRVRRHRLCARAFYNAIAALKLHPFPDEGCRSNTTIVVKNPREVDDETLRQIMKDKHRILIAGGLGKLKGSVHRIGSMGMISEQEVTATIRALEKVLREVGYPVEMGSGVNAVRETFSR